MQRTVVIVVGVPGVGKTTVLKKLKELMPEVEVVNFGDVMMDEVAKMYVGMTRDEMRAKIGPEDYKRIQMKAAERVSKQGKDILVIDTHVALKTPRGYYPGLPPEVVRVLNVDVIILLEFRPEEIMARRSKDQVSVRVRDVEGVEDIEEHQLMNRMFAIAVANEAACYLKILRFYKEQEYPYQHAEQAAREIANLISSIHSRKHLT